MTLKCILLNEISQSEKATCCRMIPFVRHYEKGKTTQSKNISGFQGCRERLRELNR